MKSKKIFPSLLIALSALFASCSKDGSQPTSESKSQGTQKISFSAELPDPAMGEDGVRTTLADDGHKVKWTAGDQISVFADGLQGANNAFTATELSTDGVEATFEGTAAEGKTKYFALYPYSASNAFDQATSTFTTNLLTEQSAVLGTYANNTSIAVATLEGYNAKTNRRLKLKNATGLLKIQFSLAPSLAGKKITKIVLRAATDTSGNRPKLSGTASVRAGSGSTRPTTTIDGNTGISYISLSNGGAEIAPTTGKAYYMVVPTQNTGSSFSLTFIAEDGSGIVKRFSIATPFASNKIKSINLNIDQLETRILRNVGLIDALQRQGLTFSRKPDGTMNYFENIESIERATKVEELSNTSNLTSLDELEYYENVHTVSLSNVSAFSGEINIQKTPRLESLVVRNTKITKLSLEGAPRLRLFQLLDNTELTAVKVKNDTSLTAIDVSRNAKLTSVDVTEAPKLSIINVQSNNLSLIDVSRNLELSSLNIANNKFQTIDLSHNARLGFFTAPNNQFASIDLSHNRALHTLDMPNNKLTTVDLSNNPELSSLQLPGNLLTGALDLSMSRKLTIVNLSNNANLSSVDISNSTLITNFVAPNTALTSMDFSNNKALSFVRLDDTQVAQIVGLSALPRLSNFFVKNAQMSSIDVSGSPSLGNIDVSGNNLTTLDISRNLQLLRAGGPLHFFGAQRTGNITVTMTTGQAARYNSHPTMKTNAGNAGVIVATP